MPHSETHCIGGSAWGPHVTATQMFGGVLYSCVLQTRSDVCTHVCTGEGAGTSLNVCACLAPIHNRVYWCVYACLGLAAHMGNTSHQNLGLVVLSARRHFHLPRGGVRHAVRVQAGAGDFSHRSGRGIAILTRTWQNQLLYPTTCPGQTK